MVLNWGKFVNFLRGHFMMSGYICGFHICGQGRVTAQGGRGQETCKTFYIYRQTNNYLT